MLGKRELYKVCCTINFELYRDLYPGSKYDAEEHLSKFLEDKRKNTAERRGIEQAMTKEAGLPDDAIILYLPPRKSQAKGIETGALDKGYVVTLGQHDAVSADVEHLGKQYKNLWRMIILVHPAYSKDAPALSKAIDKLVRSIWSEKIRLTEDSVVTTLRKACWFPYVKTTHQRAAKLYQCSTPLQNWLNFNEASETSEDQFDFEEHCDRAIYIDAVKVNGGCIDDIQRTHNEPGSLKSAVDKKVAEMIEGSEALDFPRFEIIKELASALLEEPTASAKQDTTDANQEKLL